MKLYAIVPLLLQKLIWIPTRFSLWFFGHLKITGLENLEGVKGNMIFACNHASELDPFFVPASLPFFSRISPIFYATREQSFYDESGWKQFFYGGFFFRMWGGYPVFVGLKDYEKSLREHIRIVNEGCSMCIFPEGKTTPTGTLQKGKGGITYLSTKTGRPIIPVTISGTYNVSFLGFYMRKHHMAIHFGRPLYPTDLKSHIAGLADQTALISDFHTYSEMSQFVMSEIGSHLVR